MVGTRSSFCGRRWRGEQVEAPADGTRRPPEPGGVRSPCGCGAPAGGWNGQRGGTGVWWCGGGCFSRILGLDNAKGKKFSVSPPHPPISPVPGVRSIRRRRAQPRALFPGQSGRREPLSPGREGSAAPASRLGNCSARPLRRMPQLPLIDILLPTPAYLLPAACRCPLQTSFPRPRPNIVRLKLTFNR